MSDTTVRTIRSEDSEVIVETTDPEGDHSTLEFATVKLLSNGWIECEHTGEDSTGKRFFSPDGVKSVTVEEEESIPATF